MRLRPQGPNRSVCRPEAASDAASPAPSGLRGPDLPPGPVYRTFSRPAFPEARFEPSGVARLGGGRLLVVNDKDDAPRFVVFGPAAGGFEALGRFDVPGKLKKLEDVAAAHRRPGRAFALTSFEGYPDASNDRLLRLDVSPRGQLRLAEDLPLFDPKAWLQTQRGLPYGKAEALALSADEARLFVGLRIVGPEDNVGEPRVLILDYDAQAPHEAPTALVDVDLTEVLGRPEGISALEYAPGLGAYLLTTSHELEDGDDKGSVGGHLWLIPGPLGLAKDPEAWRAFPRLRLDHKPEGVTALDDGRILVVFDDDNARKSLDDPNKFPLATNEAAYTIIDPVNLR